MKGRRLLTLTALVLIATLLPGCRPAPIVAARDLSTPITESQAPVVLTPTPEAEPTLNSTVIKISAPEIIPISQLNEEPAALDAVPLQITDPIPAEGTDWRPPLYQVPWSPGLEDHFYFTRPILVDQSGWLLDDYKYGYIYEGFDNVHTGIDIDAAVGTPVFAAGAGKIIWVGYGLLNGRIDPDDPYGLAVAIRHDFGFKDQRLYTTYSHLNDVNIQLGDLVSPGQQIGIVGTTGLTTGPHLHFEVRLGENDYFATRNPELWLAPPQGWGLLVGQIKDTAGRLIKSKEVHVSRVGTDDHWKALTYGARSVNSDGYYGENMVLSDLPAGRYKITFEYLYQRYYLEVDVNPGMVSYFSFQGRKGFSTNPPSSPAFTFSPSP